MKKTLLLSQLKKILAESNNGKTEWKFRYDHEPGHYEVITMTSFNDLYDLWYETKKDLTITFDENEFSEDDFINEVDGIIKVKE